MRETEGARCTCSDPAHGLWQPFNAPPKAHPVFLLAFLPPRRHCTGPVFFFFVPSSLAARLRYAFLRQPPYPHGKERCGGVASV
jgi:hypothetical protein